MRVHFTFTPAAQPGRAEDDGRAFAGGLTNAASGAPGAASAGADGLAGGSAAANDWPLVAGARKDQAKDQDGPAGRGAHAGAETGTGPRSPLGPLVPQPRQPAATGLRDLFQQAADDALARVDHRDAFRAPPPPASFPAAGTGARPISPPVDPGAAIAEAIRAGAEATRETFGGGSAPAPSGGPISPGAEAIAASERSVRDIMEANIARDASVVPASDMIRADLERAANEMILADARIGAMLDGAMQGTSVDPLERGELIAKAREQAQQKMRDIARALAPEPAQEPAPARDDEPPA